ncbi:MAG: hypothetical protein K6A32_03615, partial [Bacteroidales bacterium]|nr:hypothetical protein [Bacteroidales bacterium]
MIIYNKKRSEYRDLNPKFIDCELNCEGCDEAPSCSLRQGFESIGLDPCDPQQCNQCHDAVICQETPKMDCPVIIARHTRVRWFVRFWNKLRQSYKSPMPELQGLNEELKTKLRYRQTIYGKSLIRRFVMKLMESHEADKP